MIDKVANRIFVCEDCGREISYCGPASHTENVCLICNWLRDPANGLDDAEKTALRARLTGDKPFVIRR